MPSAEHFLPWYSTSGIIFLSKVHSGPPGPGKGYDMSNQRKFSFGSAVVLLIMGIVLLVWSDSALIGISMVIGAGCLIEAIALFIAGRGGGLGFTAGAVVLLIAGIVLLLHPKFIISILPVLIGIGIIVNGASTLIQALNSRAELAHTSAHLILAIKTILLGVIVLFNPFETMSLAVKLIGVIMIYNALTSFFFGKEIG